MVTERCFRWRLAGLHRRAAPAGDDVRVAGQAGGGTIVGHVHYMGPTPVNPIIRMGADPRCNMLYVGKRPTAPTFVVGTDGAFANACWSTLTDRSRRRRCRPLRWSSGRRTVTTCRACLARASVRCCRSRTRM